MAKRYMYTYTKQELVRRRWIGVIIGLPSWILVSWVVFGFWLKITGLALLVLCFLASVILVYLTWQFNTRQINTKFQEID